MLCIFFQCSVTFLGSQISSTMSVSPTISEIVKSCNFNLKKLAPFRYMLSVKHKLLLVKSFILNKVDYCSILLVNAPMIQITRLQRLLNKAIRFPAFLHKHKCKTLLTKTVKPYCKATKQKLTSETTTYLQTKIIIMEK